MLAALLILAGCVTVPVGEDDVFDPRRSVHPAVYERPGVTLEEHTIPSAQPGVELSAWWLEAEGARTTVLFFGGRDFHLVHSAGYLDSFAGMPVNALLVDYRGYGDSEGEPSLEAAVADAREAHRYLTENMGVSEDQIVAHGHSIGSYPALALADQGVVGAVALENPISRASDWERALVPWYGRIFVSLDVEPGLRTADNLARVRRVAVPLLIVAGEADRVVPAELARELYENAASEYRELVLIEGGGHNDLNLFSEYRDGYARLLEEVEGGSGGS